MEFATVCDPGSSWNRTTESSRLCLSWREALILPWLLSTWEPWGWILRATAVFSSTCWKSTASTSCWLSTTPAARKTLCLCRSLWSPFSIRATTHCLLITCFLFSLSLAWLSQEPFLTPLDHTDTANTNKVQSNCRLFVHFAASQSSDIFLLVCLSVCALSILPAILDFFSTLPKLVSKTWSLCLSLLLFNLWSSVVTLFF